MTYLLALCSFLFGIFAAYMWTATRRATAEEFKRCLFAGILCAIVALAAAATGGALLGPHMPAPQNAYSLANALIPVLCIVFMGATCLTGVFRHTDPKNPQSNDLLTITGTLFLFLGILAAGYLGYMATTC